MPNFDGTGPAGQGPMTGRGQGSCANSNQTVRGIGMGCGMGRGMRQGFGCLRGYRGNFGGQQFISLGDQEKALEEELKAVREEIKKQKK